MTTWVTGAVASADPQVTVKQVAYIGVHPIPTTNGGGFCHIEGPHVHIYRPVHADELYRVLEGRYLFIGDPVPFGYDGPKYAYYGRHPIPIDHDGTVFCYLDGPHYHVYLPPPALAFVLAGDAYWYLGDWPRSYQLGAPRYQKINAIYAPLTYDRPRVTAAAPAGYHVPVVEIATPRPPPVVVHPRPILRVHIRPWLVIDDDDDDEDDDDDVHYPRHPHHHPHHHHHHGPEVIEVAP